MGFRSSKDQPFWMFPIKLVSSDFWSLSCIRTKIPPSQKNKNKVTSGKKRYILVTSGKRRYILTFRLCVIFTFFCFLIVKAEKKLWEAVKAMKISRWQRGELLCKPVRPIPASAPLIRARLRRQPGDTAAPGPPRRRHPAGHLAGLYFRSVYLRRERISGHFMDGTLSVADSLSFITTEQWRQVGSWLISLYHFQKYAL